MKLAGRLVVVVALNFGSHFFLKALMKRLTMDMILTTLGNEKVVGSRMYL